LRRRPLRTTTTTTERRRSSPRRHIAADEPRPVLWTAAFPSQGVGTGVSLITRCTEHRDRRLVLVFSPHAARRSASPREPTSPSSVRFNVKGVCFSLTSIHGIKRFFCAHLYVSRAFSRHICASTTQVTAGTGGIGARVCWLRVARDEPTSCAPSL
jgi:hypothetical protein